MHRLGQALDHPGDGDLIDHLGQLARSGRPHMLDRLGIGLERRFRLGQSPGVAARHDAELAVLGARLAARHRGVDEAPPLPFGQRRHLARHLRRRRRVINDHSAFSQMRQPLGHDGAHVVVIADAQDEQIDVVRRLGHRLREAAARRLGPGLRLGYGAVEADDIMAGLHQVTRHRGAHDAQAGECDLHDRLRVSGHGLGRVERGFKPLWRGSTPG